MKIFDNIKKFFKEFGELTLTMKIVFISVITLIGFYLVSWYIAFTPGVVISWSILAGSLVIWLTYRFLIYPFIKKK